MKESVNGIHLYFEEAHGVDGEFIFIHGAGGDLSQLTPLFTYYQTKAHVLALDLRGHGKSEKHADGYSIEQMALDVHALCQKRGFKNPMIVGFSMGGNIAIELAARFPGFVKALIILDSALLLSAPVLAVLMPTIEALKNPAQAPFAIEQILENCTLPSDRCKAYSRDLLFKTLPHVWAAAVENMVAWDTKAPSALEKCKMPILYIEAHHRLIDMLHFLDLCPHAYTGKVVGSGHMIGIEVPQQVIPMIDRFLEVIDLLPTPTPD